MSERNESVVNSEEQIQVNPVVSEPTAPPVEPVNPADVEHVDVAISGTEEGDATQTDGEPAEPTATMAQANKTLAAFGAECRAAADRNYKLAALAAKYVNEFLGASPGKATRSSAVDRLANEWVQWDEESMSAPLALSMKRIKERVNMLLRVNAVAVLLGDGRGTEKGDGTATGRGKKGAKDNAIPWGKLRELAPLVERFDDDHVEVWGLVKDVDREKAVALVAEIATSGMARADVVKAVRVLLGKPAEETKPATVVEATEPTDGAEATATVVEPPQGAPQSPEAVQGANLTSLLSIAEAGTPKDVAEMCVELVTGGDAPDDVFEELLHLLDKCVDLSAGSHRAIKAALVSLSKGTVRGPSPAEIATVLAPPANGPVATAAQ